MDIRLEAAALAKTFNRRVIFHDISFQLTNGSTLLVTGRNGSGKSTLVKIIAGVLTPTAGRVVLRTSGRDASQDRTGFVGFVSPYLQMYDEFSARENLALALAIRGSKPQDAEISRLLERVGLSQRGDDPVRTYSSGMKQRVKYAFALVHRPPLLILDEPMANLDAAGQAMVRELMKHQQQEGILIVATNDLTDLKRYDKKLDLDGR